MRSSGAQPDYRRLVNEALGWNLIVNESVVKLEKVPPRAMPWMGIQSFQEPMDYCLLCALLLFLADLDDGAPFLLSLSDKGPRDVPGGDQAGGLDPVSPPEGPGAGPAICPGDGAGGGI